MKIDKDVKGMSWNMKDPLPKQEEIRVQLTIDEIGSTLSLSNEDVCLTVAFDEMMDWIRKGGKFS